MRHLAILFGAIVLACLLFLWPNAVLYVFIGIVVAFLVFWNYRLRLPFDLSPVLALSFVYTEKFGLLACGVFVIACGFAPSIIAGGSLDHTSVFYFFLIMAVNAVFPFLGALDFITRILVLAIAHNLFAFLGASYLGGNPGKELGGLIFKSAVDVFYILRFIPLLV